MSTDAARHTAAPAPTGRAGDLTTDPAVTPAPRRLPMAMLVLFLTQLMLVIDTTIVNVALPDIGAQLGFTTAGLSWVITAYTLFFGGFILLSGKVGTIVGPRRALLVGTAVFVAASVVGGLATTPALLVAARAGQGLGAALAAPSILVLLMAVAAPGPQRARAMALFVLATGSGAAAGLLVGGVLTDAFGWRSVMFVNVPIGAVVLVGALRVVTELPRQRQDLDIAGAAASTLTMASLVYGLTTAAEQGWVSAPVIVSFVLAAVSAIALVVVERRHPHPVVPLTFFGRMPSAAPLLAMMAIPAGQLGFLYLTTLFTQGTLGYTPLQTGLSLLPFTVGLVLTNQLTPRLVRRYGERVIGSVGIAGLVAGTAGMALSVAGVPSLAGLLVPSALLGLGAGLTFAPLTGVIMNQAPPEGTGAASSLTQGLQQLGGAIGLAVLTTVIAGRDTLTTGFVVTAAFPVVALILYAVWARRVSTGKPGDGPGRSWRRRGPARAR